MSAKTYAIIFGAVAAYYAYRYISYTGANNASGSTATNTGALYF